MSMCYLKNEVLRIQKEKLKQNSNKQKTLLAVYTLVRDFAGVNWYNLLIGKYITPACTIS